MLLFGGYILLMKYFLLLVWWPRVLTEVEFNGA
jgi:hypothetical protein